MRHNRHFGLFISFFIGCSSGQSDERKTTPADTEQPQETGENDAFLIDGECQQATITDDFSERSFTTGLIEAVRPELLNLYVDLDQMIAHVESQKERISPDTTEYFFKSAIECSLFQLGLWDVVLYEEGELETVARAALESGKPPAYGTSLMLHAGKNGSIDCEIVNDFSKMLRDTLWALTETGEASTEQARLFGQYLLFTDFFRVARDTDLINDIKAQRFPENQLTIRGDLDLDLLYDIDSAARLSVDMNADRLHEVVEASWTNDSYFHVSDCPDNRCQLKTFQLLTFTQNSDFVLDEDKMVAMLGYLLARIEAGEYTHPADFGVSPDLL